MKRTVLWSAAIVIVGLTLVFYSRDPESASESATRGRPFSPLVGKAAPAFLLPALQGGEDSLESYRGKIVVLDFWATWCGPCRRSMPILEKIEQEDPDVVVLAINLQEREATIRGFVERLNLRSRVLVDLEGKTAGAYGVESIPMHVIVDRRGQVHDVQIGFNPQMDERLRGVIARLKSSGP